MSDIIWEEPPPVAGSGPGSITSFVEALKQRPGEWAKLPKTYAGRATLTINRKVHPGTEWVARKRPDGRFDVYGRWVGES